MLRIQHMYGNRLAFKSHLPSLKFLGKGRTQGPKVLLKINSNILTFYITSITFYYDSNKKITTKQIFLYFHIKWSYFFYSSIKSVTIPAHSLFQAPSQTQPKSSLSTKFGCASNPWYTVNSFRILGCPIKITVM